MAAGIRWFHTGATRNSLTGDTRRSPAQGRCRVSSPTRAMTPIACATEGA
jgi:hypothetical protein